MDHTHPLFAELIEDILILESSERLYINEICEKLNDAKKDFFQWSALTTTLQAPSDDAEPTVFSLKEREWFDLIFVFFDFIFE